MKLILQFLLTILASTFLSAQLPSASEIIAKSIKYHDAEGQLLKQGVQMKFTETRPNGSDRKTDISFDIKEETFMMRGVTEGKSVVRKLNKGTASFSIDGSDSYTPEDMKKYRLDEKRLAMMKNYYQYLWLMPLKLNDPGTQIGQEVKLVDFFGQDLLQIRVTYSVDVGKDVWYFYFHPDTYAMSGYRFYHDESKNDGEYIILEGEVVHNGVRIPKSRTWYTHKEDKLLGTDILDQFSF